MVSLCSLTSLSKKANAANWQNWRAISCRVVVELTSTLCVLAGVRTHRPVATQPNRFDCDESLQSMPEIPNFASIDFADRDDGSSRQDRPCAGMFGRFCRTSVVRAARIFRPSRFDSGTYSCPQTMFSCILPSVRIPYLQCPHSGSLDRPQSSACCSALVRRWCFTLWHRGQRNRFPADQNSSSVTFVGIRSSTSPQPCSSLVWGFFGRTCGCFHLNVSCCNQCCK